MWIRAELRVSRVLPAELHPLHVVIPASAFSGQAAASGPGGSCVLSLHRGPASASPSGRGFFVSASFSPEEPEEAGPGEQEPLQIRTSELFLRHYGLCGAAACGEVRSAGREAAVSVWARLVQPVPPLSRAVLAARTRAAWRCLSSLAFSRRLLVLSCQRSPLLLRQGDALALPRDLGWTPGEAGDEEAAVLVLECRPVSQGALTLHTSLVLTLLPEPQAQVPAAPPPARMLCASDFAHYTGGLGLQRGASVSGSSVGALLEALECRLEARVLDVVRLVERGRLAVRPGPEARPAHSLGLDLDSCLVLSKLSLQRLGLFNREWLAVWLLETGDQEPGPISAGPRWASVLVVDDPGLELGASGAAVSHTFWFNVSGGAPLPVTGRLLRAKRVYETDRVGRCGKDSRSVLSVPPLTSELYLETITAPEYSAQEEYDSVLCQHFLIARLVQVGDVLCVPTRDKVDFIQSSPRDKALRWPVLYFRVKSLSEKKVPGLRLGYLAHREHTSLYLAGCTNSFVPSNAACAGDPVWGSASPPGLAHTVEQLTDIMLPYLRPGPSVLAGPCSVLLWGPSGSGKATVVGATCYRLHLHLVKVECNGLCGDTVGATEARLAAAFSAADKHRPCVLLLRNVQRLGAERDGVGEDSRLVATLHQLLAELSQGPREYPVLVVGTAIRMRDLVAGAQAAFLHHVELETLCEQNRRELLSALSAGLPLGSDVNLSKISQQTAGSVLGDMCALLSHASRAACERVRSGCFPGVRPSEREDLDLSAAGVYIQAQDFQTALDRLQSSNARALGAPKIPCVHWQDVGGLRDVKQEILDTIQLPLVHRELLAQGLRRSGLLLYGPPGTGKTLLAKAVATECSMSFLSVKGPELINMYVGQSEENVREVFTRARAAAPCIVFFDELDSLAPNRGRSGDSGGVMDRVVSQLLAELDGLHSSGDVFVIGATNRPDLLDQALLRPGRFDKLLYVGISEDPEAQLRVLEAITRKFQMDAGVSLRSVVERCPPHLTGADLYALCSDAMMSAMKRQISRIQQGLDTEESELLLTQEDFESALSVLEPSVSEVELSRYRQLQHRLSGK